MVAGALVLLAGPVDVGKSIVTLTIAAQVTRGTLPGVLFGQPRSVVICASEDSWAHVIAPRLLVAGADLDRVYRADVTHPSGLRGELSLPADLRELEDAIREHDVALVILDPLLSRIGTKLDSHKDAEVRQALEPLVRVADRTGAAILGIIHFRKTDGSVVDRIMASTAFVAVARLVLAVIPDAEDRGRAFLGVAKSNLGPKPPVLSYRIQTAAAAPGITAGRLVWEGEDPRSIEDLASLGSARAHTATADASEWLAELLSDGPLLSADIKDLSRSLGHSDATLRRAAHRVGVVVSSEGWPRVTRWALPTKEEAAE